MTLCEFCPAPAEWHTGGGAAAEFAVCDLHRAVCDAEPDNAGTEWTALREACELCGAIRDDFGCCAACDAERAISRGAAPEVAR